MSVQELLNRRFLLIADYPDNPANVGDIFTQIEGRAACSNGKGAMDIIELEKYPHLFRKLHWAEFRDEKYLPQYVKSVSNPNWVKEVESYDLEGRFKYKFNWMSMSLKDVLPATREEYLAAK